jgi:hypothetical protein
VATIKVHAGDFLKASGSFSFGSFVLKTKAHSFVGETIPVAQLKEVELATEDSVKRVGGTVGWGIAGGLVLGPVGLLAGLLFGGKGKGCNLCCHV